MRLIYQIEEHGDFDEIPYVHVGKTFELPDGLIAECVEHKYVDSTRWEEVWEGIFKIEEKFYRVGYLLPATEMQEFEPFGYNGEVTFEEVVPKVVEVIKYVKVEDG